MVDGKRGSPRYYIIYDAFETINKESTGNVIHWKFSNKPYEKRGCQFKLKLVVYGGSNYQVPVEVRPERQSAT